MTLHQLLVVVTVVAAQGLLGGVDTHVLAIHGRPGHECGLRDGELFHDTCKKKQSWHEVPLELLDTRAGFGDMGAALS